MHMQLRGAKYKLKSIRFDIRTDESFIVIILGVEETF